MSAVTIEERADKIRVESPYHPRFIARARQLGGSWERPYWIFSARHLERVRELCRDVYGTDGTPGPVAVLHCRLDHLTFTDSVIVGPVQVLRKAARDTTPKLGDGCAVIAGRLLRQGGSRANPRITFEPGTVVEVCGVPAELARHLAEANPDGYHLAEEEEPDPYLTPAELELVAALEAVAEPHRSAVVDGLAQLDYTRLGAVLAALEARTQSQEAAL